jgi:hypothetical protein
LYKKTHDFDKIFVRNNEEKEQNILNNNYLIITPTSSENSKINSVTKQSQNQNQAPQYHHKYNKSIDISSTNKEIVKDKPIAYKHTRTTSLIDNNSIYTNSSTTKPNSKNDPRDYIYSALNTEYVNELHNKIDNKANNIFHLNSSNNGPLLTETNIIANKSAKENNNRDNKESPLYSIVNTEPNKPEILKSKPQSKTESVDAYKKGFLQSTGIDLKKEILSFNTKNQFKPINFFNTSMSFDQNPDAKNITYENIRENKIDVEIKKKL